MVAILAALAVANIPEFPHEGKLIGWTDEALLLVIAAIAVAWYQRRRYSRSILPLLFLLGGVAVKVLAIFIEDRDDIGDDIGQASLLAVLAAIFVTIYVRTRSVKSAPPESLPSSGVL